MKNSSTGFFLIGIIGMIVLFVTLSYLLNLPKNSCVELSRAFDKDISINFSEEFCAQIKSKDQHFLVAGVLYDIQKEYDNTTQKYEYTLSIKGERTFGNVTLSSSNATTGYVKGEFYMFDLSRKCDLINADGKNIANDENFNSLQVLKCDD